MATKMKTCTRCGKRKPISGFSKDASKKDGIRNYCKECASEMNRKRAHLAKSKKRLEETKKEFRKAVNEEAAKRKSEREEKIEGAKIIISRLIESVVSAIAGNFNMRAEVMVKLHRKGSK